MRPRRIVAVTDCVDIAANEIRTSLIGATGDDPRVTIEPIVPVLPAFSIINANFAMRLIVEGYPEGTIFLSTVNPMRERPASIIGRTERNGYIFIGRNTGVFDWLTRDFGCAEVYNLDRHYGTAPGDFVSFAGKYITAPIAAKAALGVPLHELGARIAPSEIVRLDLVAGTIVHIDNFGLMKFTGAIADPEEGARYSVSINGREVQARFGRRMMSYETGTWILFPGSSYGLFELGMVRRSGVAELAASVGDVLQIRRTEGGQRRESHP